MPRGTTQIVSLALGYRFFRRAMVGDCINKFPMPESPKRRIFFGELGPVRRPPPRRGDSVPKSVSNGVDMCFVQNDKRSEPKLLVAVGKADCSFHALGLDKEM